MAGTSRAADQSEPVKRSRWEAAPKRGPPSTGARLRLASPQNEEARTWRGQPAATCLERLDAPRPAAGPSSPAPRSPPAAARSTRSTSSPSRTATPAPTSTSPSTRRSTPCASRTSGAGQPVEPSGPRARRATPRPGHAARRPRQLRRHPQPARARLRRGRRPERRTIADGRWRRPRWPGRGGRELARASVTHPVEGTILSVARGRRRGRRGQRRRRRRLYDVPRRARRGPEALAETTEQLPALRARRGRRRRRRRLRPAAGVPASRVMTGAGAPGRGVLLRRPSLQRRLDWAPRARGSARGGTGARPARRAEADEGRRTR